MRTERDAFLAAQQRHHQYMVFGKKQRYIEVFQCSGDDMNHLLTGSGPLSAAAANQAAAMAAAAVASQAKNANAGLLPPGMFPAFPGALPTSAMPPGMDPNMAAQLHNQLQFLTTQQNLAALGSPFPPGFPPATGMRPPSIPGLTNPFPSPGQLRPQSPGDPSALWALNPSAGLTNPLLSLSVPTSLATGGLPSPQQQQQAALMSQNFGLQNFLLQTNGQLRLPGSQPQMVVSSSGGLSPQNAALYQSQLAAQRFLMQQQQQQQQHQTMTMQDSLALHRQMSGLPPPSYLPPISVASSLPAIYTSTSNTLGSISAPKRSFDQAFVANPAAVSPASSKRVNYGYGVLAASPAPTISAAPTTYYAATPNPT